jgi:hypothetical protein
MTDRPSPKNSVRNVRRLYAFIRLCPNLNVEGELRRIILEDILNDVFFIDVRGILTKSSYQTNISVILRERVALGALHLGNLMNA